jgi:plastocyanin
MKRLTLTFGLLVLAVATAACSPASGANPPAPSGPVDPHAPVVVAQNNVFAPATVYVKSGKAFSLKLDNKDAAPHNVAIFNDSSAAEKISIGEIVSSTSATQQVPALDKGQYFFRCDVHQEMTGTIVAE